MTSSPTIEMRPIGTTDPIWVAVSASHVGINELPGKLSQAVILQWAADLGVSTIYKDDDTAWCALYFWRLMMACQIPIPAFASPYDYLRARKVAECQWGQVLTYDAYGMVGVYDRPGGAHVGLILGQRQGFDWVRGGNQSNRVGYSWIERERRLANGRLWPLGFALPAPGLPHVTAAGTAISRNEA